MMGVSVVFHKMPFKVVKEFAKLVDAEIVEHFRGFAELEKWVEEVPGENYMFIELRVEREHYAPIKSTLITEDKETGIRVYEKMEYRKDGTNKTRFYIVYMPQPVAPQQLYEVYMECMGRFND